MFIPWFCDFFQTYKHINASLDDLGDLKVDHLVVVNAPSHPPENKLFLVLLLKLAAKSAFSYQRAFPI